jgi:4-hydroxybenzoate polyprenyltransferase
MARVTSAERTAATAPRSWRAHLEIMRVDHWVKNALVVPGIVVALTVEPERASWELVPRLAVGFLAIGLVASSNYTINELLDGPYDVHHPTKSQRRVPRGAINPRLAWLQWVVLMVASVSIGVAVSVPFAITLLTLWVFGTLYNLEPIRTKDIPYVDVATEALNNPIRLLAGWFIVGLPFSVIPVSLVLSYWMIGGYFMAIKRYAELRNVATAIDMSR